MYNVRLRGGLTRNEDLFDNIRVHYPFLFQVMGNGILRQQWSLQTDFGANPLAFVMWHIRSVLASAAAAKLRTKRGALDFVILPKLTPSFVANHAGDIDFQSDSRHFEPLLHEKPAEDFTDTQNAFQEEAGFRTCEDARPPSRTGVQLH